MAASGGCGGCCPPMDLLRSESMHLAQLIITIEAALLTAAHLGDLGLIQFKDGNRHTIRHETFAAFVQLLQLASPSGANPSDQLGNDIDGGSI